MLGTALLIVIFVVTFGVFHVPVKVQLMVAAAGAGAIFLSLFGVLASRKRRWVGYALSVPAIPPIWFMALLDTGAYLVLFLLIHSGRKLLSGPNRLRGVVFGGGILLLFGGMAAQFAATF
jgi:hypothetical protein